MSFIGEKQDFHAHLNTHLLKIFAHIFGGVKDPPDAILTQKREETITGLQGMGTS